MSARLPYLFRPLLLSSAHRHAVTTICSAGRSCRLHAHAGSTTVPRRDEPVDPIERKLLDSLSRPLGKPNPRFNSNDNRKFTPRERQSLRQSFQRPKPTLPIEKPPPTSVSREVVAQLLQARAQIWKRQPSVQQRLVAFGVPESELPILLSKFTWGGALRAAVSPSICAEASLVELYHDLHDVERPHDIERGVTRTFYAWCTAPETTDYLLKQGVNPMTLSSMRALFAACDRSFPAEQFAAARAMRRKIIMHVGPTNSGKTHNALRALAVARTGTYAGPLRLLAHEIWERLNKGQIVPAGVDHPPPSAEEAADDSNLDAGDAPDATPTIVKTATPRYARECNMITGEERKVVSESAGLVACTVEMVSFTRKIDVAVIDEIQLLADPDRGGAWTSAVLGVPAREVHLCGEETAIPVVEALCRETGDELVVNRYERLTPLRVAEESLNGDLKKVEKGDCVVAFSRSGIFGLKTRIEKLTKLKCAVAYGALPPEVRSEQAALFNDPNSGYDVLVGSDAVGMGLNLKVKRIILDTVTKWNGQEEVSLSVSQIKQIAGRAGRFGLHGDDTSGGVATTLREDDLPVLRQALAAPLSPVPYARLSVEKDTCRAVLQALPPDADTATLFEAIDHLTRTRAPYKPVDQAQKAAVTHLLDADGGEMDLRERLDIVNAPINFRDQRVADGITEMVRQYRESLHVSVGTMFEKLKLTEHLEKVLQRRVDEEREARERAEAAAKEAEEMARLKAEGKRVKFKRPRRVPKQKKVKKESISELLPPLESMHRLLTLYAWLANRNPVSWSELEQAMVLKATVEEAMEWCLQAMAYEEPPKPPQWGRGGGWKGGKGQGGHKGKRSGSKSKEAGQTDGVKSRKNAGSQQRSKSQSGKKKDWRRKKPTQEGAQAAVPTEVSSNAPAE